jgi:short-subunit dehydrogenase
MSQKSGVAKVVVVTGASSGIGRAVAPLLAARGDHLVLSSRSNESLQAVRDECVAARTPPPEVAVVTADVKDPGQVDALFAAAVARFGRVDAVAHCAGALAYGVFVDLPADVFDATVITNLGGTAHVARAALSLFRRQGGGTLVVVGSVLGKIAAPTMSAYITTKWAVHGLIRTLQLEARDQPGVHVSLVSPGGVDTPIYRQAGTYTGHHGAPPPPVARAELVARGVVKALDRPRRELGVGRTNPLMVLAFRLAPAVFDAAVGPLFARLARARDGTVPATAGNLFSPHPAGESVSGGYDRWGRHPPDGAAPMTPQRSTHRNDPGPTVSRSVAAPAEAVWDVLSDGWSYATWVVGAARVRDVDPGWPAPGTRVHHSFGLWPALIQDYTRVERSNPGQELELRARGWPLGEAHVHLSVRSDGPQHSNVTITEDAVAGPGRLIPAPLRHLLISPLNRETLHRLALLAEGHHRKHT